MLKFDANFHYKDRYVDTKSCIVEETIRLTGEDYDDFKTNLLKDYDFIKENLERMFYDADNTRHCLLVTGEGHESGVLVYSEGHDYARYTSYVPDARALVAAQSPALTKLGEKLTAFTDYLATEYLAQLKTSDRAALYLHGQATDFDIDLSYSETLRETVIEMVGERLDGHGLDMEFDNGDLIVTPRAPEMRMEM